MPLNCYSASSAAHTDLSLRTVYSTHPVNSQASSQTVGCSSLTQTSRKNDHLWLDLTVCTDIYGKELPWKNDYGWISWSVYIYIYGKERPWKNDYGWISRSVCIWQRASLKKWLGWISQSLIIAKRGNYGAPNYTQQVKHADIPLRYDFQQASTFPYLLSTVSTCLIILTVIVHS